MLNQYNYIKYRDLLKDHDIKNVSIELYYILLTLRELHESSTGNISVDELSVYFFVKYPSAKPDVYKSLFEQLAVIDIADSTAELILNQIRRQNALVKLSEVAYAASQGTATSESLQESIRSVTGSDEETHVDEDQFVSTDLEEIVKNVVSTRGIRFPLQCLNKSLGSLRTGDFGFIFARPETGKTTFIASLVANALGQVERPVVWFNNEEVGEKVMLRVYQAYFGVTTTALLGNVKHYKAVFKEKVGDKFKLLDSANISRTTVEDVCRQNNPSLVVFDQIDKLKGFRADRDDLVYGAIYQWARELAKSYCPVIGVSQAGGMAEGQRWLTMDHVANAKTSKQAEADWILGIGKSHDENEEMVRYLAIAKNKLLGDDDTRAELRHARFEVMIQPQLARFKDIVDYS